LKQTGCARCKRLLLGRFEVVAGVNRELEDSRAGLRRHDGIDERMGIGAQESAVILFLLGITLGIDPLDLAAGDFESLSASCFQTRAPLKGSLRTLRESSLIRLPRQAPRIPIKTDDREE
jgi:hypothetical protein